MCLSNTTNIDIRPSTIAIAPRLGAKTREDLLYNGFRANPRRSLFGSAKTLRVYSNHIDLLYVQMSSVSANVNNRRCVHFAPRDCASELNCNKWLESFLLRAACTNTGRYNHNSL